MSKPLLFLCLSLLAFSSSAQNPAQAPAPSAVVKSVLEGSGRISGQVIDAETKQPVEFATIALVQVGTGKTLDGTVADDKGRFTLSKVPVGTYQLNVSFVGYKTQQLNHLQIAQEKDHLQVGTILLSAEARKLQEVLVEGEKPLIEEKVDRLVYNAEKDISALGGTAADVLRNVPMLTVDGDGNVQLRGSSNIRVLINNRPSSIMAANVADAIRQIPADIIKSVEVFTSPSAKYDAEGTAGIINIITKKNTLQGVTGGGSITPGNVSTIGSANLNMRRGDFGISSAFSTNQFYNRGKSFLERINLENEDRLVQEGTVKTRNGFLSTQLGVDYNLSDRSSIGAGVRLNPDHDYIDNYRTATTYRENQPSTVRFFDSDTRNKGLGYDLNLDYLYTFKKPQQEFSILTLYSNYHSEDNTYQNEYGPGQELLSIQNSQNQYENGEFTVQADYLQPVGKSSMMEIGAKIIQRQASSDGSIFGKNISSGQEGTTQNAFSYEQDIYASYLTYSFKLLQKLNMKVGGRYEKTFISADFKTDYDNFIPSAALSYTHKEKHTFKVNFTQRIQRPQLYYLNPFRQIISPQVIRIGNPNLDAELTNLYELSYGTYTQTGSLNVSLYGRTTDNAIMSIPLLQNDTTYYTFDNIARTHNYGVNVYGSIKPIKAWTINSNLNVYYANLKGFNTSNNGFMYNWSASTSFDLGKGWIYRFNGSFTSRRVVLQGRMGAFYYHNTTLRKDIFNKRGGIGINLANPFMKGTRMRNNLRTEQFLLHEDNINYTRGVRLTFEYRFGKLEPNAKPRKAKKNISNDDALRN